MALAENSVAATSPVANVVRTQARARLSSRDGALLLFRIMFPLGFQPIAAD
jgi:hypothetical protein